MVRWSKSALNDLQSIYDYISEDSLQNAEKVVITLLNVGNRLDYMPNGYPIEPFLNKEHTRFVVKWQFKIIYRIFKKHITIKRVFHTKQNPKKIR